MAKKDKRPKVAREPAPAKRPKFQNDPQMKGAPLMWRFSHGDQGGPFAWSSISSDELQMVIKKLASFETMEERDIVSGGSHAIELWKLCKEARDRLAEIQMDDLDSLYSLRMTGEERVFCVHYGNVMRVLWWDPKHQVCPSNKKHT